MPYYSQDATSIDLNTVQSNLGLSGQRSMNDAYIRYYAGRAGSGTSISFSDFRNTSAVTIPSLNTTYTVASSYTKIYHVYGTLSIYGTGAGEGDYGYENFTDIYNSYSHSAQYSASDIWIQQSPTNALVTYYDNRPYGYCNAPGRGYQSFIIPLNCSSVLIKAWGGGGGSGGSYTGGSVPGWGGGGGYATTTLIVGTHCSIGQVLHCFAGLGGPGGGQLWFGGNGGTASYVGLTTKAFGNQQIDERDWGTPGISLLNSSVFGPSNAVLIAGGGGGGGAINSSGGKAGNGGGGGEASSGSGGEYSGSSTGATTYSHGAGEISDISNQICGVAGGGRIRHSSRTVWDEASIATILGNSRAGTAYNYSDSVLGAYKTRSGGGGGAFQGSPDWRTIGSGSTNNRNIGRGGGGGSNKIYRGYSQYIENGNGGGTPGNYAYAGNYGYGSTSKGANNGDNYGGAPGRAGKIEIIFS